MKHLFYSLLISLLPGVAAAQSFTYSQGGAIPDNGPETCFTLPVSGLPASADTTFGLASVTLNLTHPYTGDLTIRLRTPSGTYIPLVDRRGGGGDNFVQTVLRMNAPVLVALGNPPFTGSFVPEASLNLANAGASPNGTWSLCIQDLAAADVGNLNDFTLTFGPNPPRDPAAPPQPCSALNAASCHCPDSTVAVCDLLPDMTASADIMANQHTETAGRLTLSNATPNVGWGPMEIHGSGQCFCDTVAVACTTTLCPNGEAPKEQVLQTIYRKNGAAMTSYQRPAGFMSFHPGHGHVHVDNWSQFTLRTQGPNPDPRTWPVVVAGGKLSFCLINLGDCTTNPGYCRDQAGRIITRADIPNDGFGTVTGCGRDQGIFVGHLDIYDQNLPGQFIDLPNVCNGTYYLVSVTDPNNNFLETDESNNAAATPIVLTRQLTRATPAFSYSQVGGQFAFSGGGLPAGGRFRWNFHDGSPLDSVNNPTIHTFTTSGAQMVTFTILSRCGADSVTRSFTVLSTGRDAATAAAALQVRAVPNPTTGAITMQYTLPAPQAVTLDAYDLLGRRIRHQALGRRAAGPQTTPLLLADDVPAGVYLVWLRTETGSQAVRVVKE